MKYMVLLFSDESIETRMNEDEWQALLEEHNVFGTRFGDKILSGEPLDRTPTAKTLRRVNGSITTFDGPFAETKEALGGYYVIEAESMDEAVEIASHIPLSDHGSTEIRPVMEM